MARRRRSGRSPTRPSRPATTGCVALDAAVDDRDLDAGAGGAAPGPLTVELAQARRRGPASRAPRGTKGSDHAGRSRSVKRAGRGDRAMRGRPRPRGCRRRGAAHGRTGRAAVQRDRRAARTATSSSVSSPARGRRHERLDLRPESAHRRRRRPAPRAAAASLSRWTRAARIAAAAWRAKTASSSMSRSEKVGDVCLSSTWSTPTCLFPVDQRNGRDRARHVARALGRRAVEARIAQHVGERERLAGREDEADDAARRRHREADGAGTLGTGCDAELEPIRVALEQGDRRRLGLEQGDSRVDDRLEQRLLGVRVEAAGNRRPPRCLAKCLQRGGQSARRITPTCPSGGRSGRLRFSAAPCGPRHRRRRRRGRRSRLCVALDIVVVRRRGLDGSVLGAWPSTSSSPSTRSGALGPWLRGPRHRRRLRRGRLALLGELVALDVRRRFGCDPR